MAFGAGINVGSPYPSANIYAQFQMASGGYGFDGPFGSYTFPGGSDFLNAFRVSTYGTRTGVLWDATIGGAVGATASGPGILDATGVSLGGLGDVQSGAGPTEVPSPVDWVSIFLPPVLQQKKEPIEVAIDWGGVLGGIVGLGTTYIETKYAQPTFQSFVGGPVPQPAPEGNIGGPEGITWGNGGAGAPPMATNAACPPAGSCGPRYLTYDCKTGQMTVRRRRRRGKLLTAGRKEDLAFVIAMYGKGAASQIALAKAMS